MFSIPWANADLSPFDRSRTDKAKIETGHPVPCRLCEAVYKVLTLTMRYCSTCEHGYCEPAHGGWAGRRGACVQCGPLQARSPEFVDAVGAARLGGGGNGVATVPAGGPSQRQPRTPFDVFWERLQQEFAGAPLRHGEHVLQVQNWTRKHGDLPDMIPVRWTPGRDTVVWETRDRALRQFSAAEARKVYEVWSEYRAGNIGRSHITNTLGVQNSKPIIALFRRYEQLMA
jgi:hypothetical protein